MARIEELLDRYQSNAYPAMLEDLGRHLNVSPQSLTRLALGWAPIIELRRGKSFQGWWAIPERDTEGRPVGMGLRNQRDDKLMYPGSRHGLIYEVNPLHERGGGGYTPGADNWVRADADHLCPVCGKPDGCILSSENPADPRAVGCIREQSPRRIGSDGLPTWLHIRKSEGNIKVVSPLPDNEGPAIVVEGMTDTAAAMDLGFDAVGRPSALACMDQLQKLLWGRREVIVVGENDQKPGGRWPGREGMLAAFQTLRKVCKKVTMLMPPEGVKDLRAWYVLGGLTREGFLSYHTKFAEQFAEEIVLEDSRPLTIAKAYLDSEYRIGKAYSLRRWANTWYRFDDTKYIKLDSDNFIAPIFEWAHTKLVKKVDSKGNESMGPLVANLSMISNLEAAAASATLVQSPTVPCWVNDELGPDTRDLIVFENGILDVPEFLKGSTELMDSTPHLFTTTAIPYAFDPLATCSTWLAFLQASLGDDYDKIKLLQEWFGYCLTSDTSLQKMMFLRGPPAAGKGIIVDTLCQLVGENQAAATSFSELSGSFGVQSLMDKLVCVIPDARTPRFGDNVRGLELLLNIASGDGIQVNRKFKDPIERQKLVARITIASNEFLDVPDHSGAMLRRLNIVEFCRSFAANPDPSLRRRIDSEVQGVAVWATEGLRRLRDQGHFTVPASSEAAKQEWRTQTSPLAEFLEQCTDVDPQGEVAKAELFDAWEKWARERHSIRPISFSRFVERLRSNAPYAMSDSYEKGGHKFCVYRGLTMKAWAAKHYLGVIR